MKCEFGRTFHSVWRIPRPHLRITQAALIIMGMAASGKIARLKITLRDVKPAVTRRIEVPLDLRLDRLHEVLQVTVGWMGSHLWEFWARDARWGRKWEDDDFIEGPSDARKATLLGIVEGMGAKSFKYIYDFGDHWEHMIKV